VSASEDIFTQICLRIAPALARNYGLSTEEIAFFTAHEAIGEQLTLVDETLLARYHSYLDRHMITRAIRLSHEFELLFYDTVMAE
jgi:thiaminase/transcriptional activator TenA